MPQHIGDFIFPSHFGHREICTLVPSASTNDPFTSGWLHFAHVALTDIPHEAQEYVAFIPKTYLSIVNLLWLRWLIEIKNIRN
jgi:hypothetical protein